MSDQTPQDPGQQGQYPPPPPPQQQPWAPTGQQPGYVPGQPYPQQPGYGYPAMAPPTTSQATTALVLGIAGLVVCPGILSIPAWIIGSKAVKEIDASNGQLGGRSSAHTGYILGIIGTVLAAIAVVIGIVAIVLLVATASIDCTTTSSDSGGSVNCS